MAAIRQGTVPARRLNAARPARTRAPKAVQEERPDTVDAFVAPYARLFPPETDEDQSVEVAYKKRLDEWQGVLELFVETTDRQVELETAKQDFDTCWRTFFQVEDLRRDLTDLWANSALSQEERHTQAHLTVFDHLVRKMTDIFAEHVVNISSVPDTRGNPDDEKITMVAVLVDTSSRSQSTQQGAWEVPEDDEREGEALVAFVLRELEANRYALGLPENFQVFRESAAETIAGFQPLFESEFG